MGNDSKPGDFLNKRDTREEELKIEEVTKSSYNQETRTTLSGTERVGWLLGNAGEKKKGASGSVKTYAVSVGPKKQWNSVASEKAGS